MTNIPTRVIWMNSRPLEVLSDLGEDRGSHSHNKGQHATSLRGRTLEVQQQTAGEGGRACTGKLSSGPGSGYLTDSRGRAANHSNAAKASSSWSEQKNGGLTWPEPQSVLSTLHTSSQFILTIFGIGSILIQVPTRDEDTRLWGHIEHVTKQGANSASL